MHEFLEYTYQSGATILDGDPIGGPDGPEFILHHAECTRFPKDSPWHNPYGVWRLGEVEDEDEIYLDPVLFTLKPSTPPRGGRPAGALFTWQHQKECPLRGDRFAGTETLYTLRISLGCKNTNAHSTTGLPVILRIALRYSFSWPA
jgi:hypothetical protein